MRVTRKQRYQHQRTAKIIILNWRRLLIKRVSWSILFGLFVTSIAVQGCGAPILVGIAIGFATALALLVCLILATIAYAAIRLPLRLAWLRNEQRDLALARRCTGENGRVIRRPPLTLWHYGASDWSPMVLDQFDEALRRFNQLLRETFVATNPARVLLFVDYNHFARYSRQVGVVASISTEVFVQAGNSARIAVLMPNPFKRLLQPDRVLRVLFSSYLLHSYKRFQLRPWLYPAFGGLIARDRSSGEAARLNRKVLCSTIAPGDLFGPPTHVRLQAHAAFAHVAQYVFCAISVLDYLIGSGAPAERAEAFRAFFKDLNRRDDYDVVFRRHFGYGLDHLYNNWRAWVLAKGIGEHEPPPAAIRQALLDHVIPLVADRYAVAEERVRAIRDMGQAGYTLGADTLIDLLRDGHREVRASAAWALEAISGTAGGEDIAHWEAWWDALPHDVEPADFHNDVAQLDQRLFQKES